MLINYYSYFYLPNSWVDIYKKMKSRETDFFTIYFLSSAFH